MYTEEYEERGFPIRNFLIKFIIIVIIVLLLIWLLPKFIKPKNVGTVTVKDNKVKEEEVYQKNVDSMENAAFKYYGKDNLPKSEGKYKQVTLKELIDGKYIKSLKNADGKKINTKKSYLKLTKVDENEYVLKINLNDDEIEDYVLLTVGHYDYCEDYICEKKEDVEEENKAKEEIADDKVNTAIGDVEEDNQNNNTKTVVDKSYRYIKTIPAKLSNWSNWSNWYVVSCNDSKDITCEANNSKCLKEIKTTISNGSCYESTRTRSILISSYTVTRYSTANDQELLNDGWVYIGK